MLVLTLPIAINFAFYLFCVLCPLLKIKSRFFLSFFLLLFYIYFHFPPPQKCSWMFINEHKSVRNSIYPTLYYVALLWSSWWWLWYFYHFTFYFILCRKVEKFWKFMNFKVSAFFQTENLQNVRSRKSLTKFKF